MNFDGPGEIFTKREPLGVLGLITPWNYPLMQIMWKVAPALAYGNTQLIKPSEFSSLSMLKLQELLDASGLYQKGVI